MQLCRKRVARDAQHSRHPKGMPRSLQYEEALGGTLRWLGCLTERGVAVGGGVAVAPAEAVVHIALHGVELARPQAHREHAPQRRVDTGSRHAA